MSYVGCVGGSVLLLLAASLMAARSRYCYWNGDKQAAVDDKAVNRSYSAYVYHKPMLTA